MSGASNGTSRRLAFDRWFRYPAGFSPQALHAALDGVDGLGADSLVVDCFAGSASVGTALGHLSNASFVGIEAHPMIAQLGALKFQPVRDPEELVDMADQIVIAASARTVSVEAEPELVRRCFDQQGLVELVALREEIAARTNHRLAEHARWALLATLRDVANVKVGWPYQRPALSRIAPHRQPGQRFVARMRMMADDLAGLPRPLRGTVASGDSREPAVWARALGDRTAALCISSPPYLNNFDYADATRLEAFFDGIASTWAEMCQTVRGDMLVATTQQTTKRAAARALDQLAVYPRTHHELLRLSDQLSAERLRRSRGKEYDRVLGPYFLGLARVLACLFDALAPGAQARWVIGDSAPYGIYVDTPRLIAMLAEETGFGAVQDLPLRTRGSRWRTNGSRHQVELSERVVCFSRPACRPSAPIKSSLSVVGVG